MTTKREIIHQAFEEIGLASYVFDLTAEEYQSCLRRLNNQAAQWDGIGVRLGFDMGGGLDAESGLPDTAINAYALNLGVSIAPGYGKVPSMETKVAAKQAFNMMLATGYVIPQVQFGRNMPVGDGNKMGVKDQQYFIPDDPLESGNDGVIIYE